MPCAFTVAKPVVPPSSAEVAGRKVRTGPVLHFDHPDVRYHSGLGPGARDVTPQGKHHGPMTHHDRLVNPRGLRDPIERRSGALDDLQEGFAALRPPRPVGSGVVSRAGCSVGMARQSHHSRARAGRTRSTRRAPRRRGQDVGGLAGAQERARDDRRAARSGSASHAPRPGRPAPARRRSTESADAACTVAPGCPRSRRAAPAAADRCVISRRGSAGRSAGGAARSGDGGRRTRGAAGGRGRDRPRPPPAARRAG